ncbi:MAG: hypothetical protein HY296_04845 [Thaumarchaeota archaeon]|nr:hypothetical protein [Nitrososphaerota archaeon]
MPSIEIELIGKEREHYNTLEELYSFSNGSKVDSYSLAAKLRTTVDDWDRLQGGTGQLTLLAAYSLESISKSDLEGARASYLLLSPLFLFIRALNKMSRKDWRETVTACGILCERLVRNLFFELDRTSGTKVWETIKDAKFEDRNGRLLKELQERGFQAAGFHGSLGRIYFVRNRQGPHDVPPPEPIQAKISVNECLPVYVDYLAALTHLGINFPNLEGFIEVFSNTTQVRPALVFGEETTGPIPIREFITNVLFREGFFRDGKTSGEVISKLNILRRNYDDATVKNALRNLSTRRDAILSRKEKGKVFIYFERLPPDEYFKQLD